MNVINNENGSHTLRVIPRFYDFDDITFVLRNENTKAEVILVNTSIIINGFLYVDFDFDFKENERYSFVLKEYENVIYRGLIETTSQTPQNYKIFQV